LLPDFHFADYRAAVGVVTAFECDQRLSDTRYIALDTVEFHHFASVWRGYVDDGLGGFDRCQRLVDTDRIASLDVPRDDFGFLQAFAEIGKFEDSHCLRPVIE
jgi:hypothetical protein